MGVWSILFHQFGIFAYLSFCLFLTYTFQQKTVPGEPQEVRVNPVNSTTINVQWKPPLEKDRNGIIRGYHIHVTVPEEVQI